MWIDGAGRDASDGRELVVTDPGSGEVVAGVADGDVAEARAAVAAAASALQGWAATSPRARSGILMEAFGRLLAQADRFAELIVRENGKTLADAAGEVSYSAEFLRWFAEECVRTEGEYGASPAGGTRTIVTSRPVGVAALVTPWNFPAAMVLRKVAPALAAGCTVVLKPAEETPLTALALAELLHEAGVPAGVVNVLPTSNAPDVVATWLDSREVRAISFTGSTHVGRTLLGHAAQRVVNTSMELGGNAPFVVFDDADVDAAVAGAMTAKFRNGGQACTAANRLYVHADVVEEFTVKFGAEVAALRIGHGLEPTTDVGPLIARKAVDGVRSLIARAVAAGARVTHQSAVPDHLAGHFVPATVLRDVTAASPLVQEEIFGPVAAIVTWQDESAVLDEVNDTEFGLASYVYSRDLKRALKFAERLEAGMVGINRGVVSDPSAPFGGMKQSGIGREGARAGLREFREVQYFSVDWS
ncbi:aldehyde dehydrogenase family protein [Nocardioides sp. IC4_145]|nr:aldehyde dehydrogenase family protein [Nocardioides sp. IC4_145]